MVANWLLHGQHWAAAGGIDPVAAYRNRVPIDLRIVIAIGVAHEHMPGSIVLWIEYETQEAPALIRDV
jgi:hypothetical protein